MMNFIYNYTIICIVADVVTYGVSLNGTIEGNVNSWLKGFYNFSIHRMRETLHTLFVYIFIKFTVKI